MPAKKYMVLKPIVYHGTDEVDNEVVAPGAVLDFSHLSQEEIDGLFSTFTLGPADKKEFRKRLEVLRKEAKEREQAEQVAQKVVAEAIEMRILMKEQANLKEKG